MLGFTRNHTAHREATDLIALVEEVLVLTEKDLSKHHVHVDKKFHGRPKAPVVYQSEADCPFEIGKAIQLRDGDDVTIVANGLLVAAALQAHDQLGERGISARVLDLHTVKPLDEDALERAARETGRIVVAEEHLSHGGLGSVVAMSLALRHPCPMAFVNVGDTYAESGTADELMEKYGLTTADVVRAAEHLIRR